MQIGEQIMPGPGANARPVPAGNSAAATAPRAASVPAADSIDGAEGLHRQRGASPMHNLTIAWLDEAAPPEVAALGPDELQALATQIDESSEALKRRKDVLEAGLALRYLDRAKARLVAEGKD